jgi:hypothetical protein
MHRTRYWPIALAAAATTLAGAAALGQPPAAPPPPVEEKKDVPPADDRGQLMETVGLLSGLYLYQSYLNIGLIADGKAEKIYDEKSARSVLGSIVTPLDTVDKQLAKVGKAARTEADRDAVDKLRQIVTLLRQQGRDLTAFWDSASPDDGAKYEATRRDAWKQINALLGLDKK